MRYNIKVRKNAYVPLAQPDRVFGYEPKGRGFESLKARQTKQGDIHWISPCFVFRSLYDAEPRKFPSAEICYNVRMVTKPFLCIIRTFGF